MMPSTKTAAHRRLWNFLKRSTERTNTHTNNPSMMTDTQERHGEIVGKLSYSTDEMESIPNTSPTVADQQQRIIEQEAASISDLSILEQSEAPKNAMMDTVPDHAQQTNWTARKQAAPFSPQWTANSKTARYGSKLESIQNANKTLIDRQLSMPDNVKISSKPIRKGRNSEYDCRKRILAELRKSIHESVQGVSFSPVGDNIFHLIACIEGPPDTPYEDGIFWIDIQIPDSYPFRPPKMRFITKVYHPNIDSRGAICMDILEWGKQGKWCPVHTVQLTLIAIVSLLGHPTLEDIQEPLVPEIAQTYLEDYDLYCKNARKYTQLYAKEMAPPEICS